MRNESAASCNSDTTFWRSFDKLLMMALTLATITLGPSVLIT